MNRCFFMVSLIFTLAAGLSGAESSKVPFWTRNSPSPVILLTEPAGRESRANAEMLAGYFQKSTGVRPAVQSQWDGKGSVIQLVVKADSAKDQEEFTIRFPAPERVIIESPSEIGLRHGIHEFLETALGIRWLFPGPLGEYIPVRSEMILPEMTIHQIPSYKARVFALEHQRAEQYDWARHNRIQFGEVRNLPGRIWAQHNLLNLVPPAEYVKTNPEFFPILKGERFLPAPGQNIFWQPCLTAPGIVDAFVKGINRQLQKECNISIAVNDGAHHCECARCLAVDGQKVNRFGFPDRSRSYFQCFNEVVRRCAAPGRRFAFSAYDSISDPPETLKLESSLCPTLTYSRLNWISPERRANDRNSTLRWRNAVNNTVGWYDYLQLRDSVIPKVYFNLMTDYIRWGAENGVAFYYVEAYPPSDPYSAPMLYLLCRLLWNPSVNADAVLHEWFVCAVGEKAAPYLEEYYRFWSDYWEKEVSKTSWFQPDRQYMMNGSSNYLERLDFKKLDYLRGLLEKTVQYSNHPERARLFLNGFLQREAQIRQYGENLNLEKQQATRSFGTRYRESSANRPLKWSSWQRDAGKAQFVTTEKGELKMNAAGAYKSMVFMKNFPVKPGMNYRVSAQVKTLGADASGTVGVTVAWAAPGKDWLPDTFNVSKTLLEDSSYQWRKITVYVKSPMISGCIMKILLVADHTVNGEILWNNIEVEEEK